MSITQVEELAGLLLGDDAGAAADPVDDNSIFLGELDSTSANYNPEIKSVIPAGHLFPLFVSLKSRKDEIPFSTMQVAAVLARLGNFGANVGTTKLFYRTVENLDGPELASDAVHSVLTASKAFAYAMSLTAGHRTEAVVRGRVVPLEDGTNVPLARSGTETLSVNPVADEQFELGPMFLGSHVVEGADNLEVNLNPNLYEMSDESRKRTNFSSIKDISPVLSFQATDRDVDTLEGPAVNFTFYLVRLKNFDECYLPNEAQHIKCVVPRGLLVKSSRQDSPNVTRMELHAGGDHADGWLGNPVQWTVNSTIDLL
ncbi:MAG: hypothetical protein ABJZ55_20435 [Fuerstiella sp.]